MAEPGGDGADRRRYDSPVRREQKARTWDRIVDAGAELVRLSQDWEWQDITCDAVAAHAGVAKRTVYRHFSNERDLHAAIMARLSTQAGVDYSAVTLDTVAETANRVFGSLGSFAAAGAITTHAAAVIRETGLERREALLRAVTIEYPEMTAAHRTTMAAALDVLWSTSAYALLIDTWDMSHEDATEVLAWAIHSLIDTDRGG